MTIRRSIIKGNTSKNEEVQLRDELEEVILLLKKNNDNEKILNFILSNKDEIIRKALQNLDQKNNMKITTFYPME